MIIIQSNKIIDWLYNKKKSVEAVNLILFIFVRDIKDRKTVKHELTHTFQMMELGFIFYILILIGNMIYNRKVKYKHITDKKSRKILSYRNLLFEREAFANEERKGIRIPFTYLWLKYVEKG